MRKNLVLLAVATMVGLCLTGPNVRAGGPEVGVNLGAVVPLSKYRRTIDGNVGGTFGLAGGYRFDVSDKLALSLIGQPQFTFLPTDDCCGKTGDDVSSMFIGTAGPKLTLTLGDLETFATVQGGYYRDMSGLMNESGGGFNAGGGVNYLLARGTSLGLYARYDNAYIDATPDSNDRRQFLLAGIGVQHVFLPAERAPVAPPPPPPPPPPPAPKRKIVLRGVNFDFDKATIRPDARPVLDEAARVLKEEHGVDISVEGHTDSVGTDAYNQGLSERRARAVADYLATEGIARSRMRTVGYGESRPVASNETADGRAQNRRVELKIIGE
jgi:outer membrane protein OmpA-like peptidoglycan-associated protein